MLAIVDLLISKINVVLRNTGNPRQPGDLGVLRGVAECVAEEARTRGFASLALARFAFGRAKHGIAGGNLKSWQARIDSSTGKQIALGNDVRRLRLIKPSPIG